MSDTNLLYDRWVERRARNEPKKLTCPFGHKMRIQEPGVWYCDHELCKALMVRFKIPGSYKLHEGTDSLIFSEEENSDYINGKEPLSNLIRRKLSEPTTKRRTDNPFP